MMLSKMYLFSAVVIGVLMVGAVSGQSQDPPEEYCIDYTSTVGTGCWNQTCDTGGTVFMPAQGYVRRHDYQCCYIDNILSSTRNFGCTDTLLSGGCCSLIAPAPDCPQTPNCNPHN
jgi:hypothetical protein